MRLHLCTWPTVEDYLKSSSGIIIPIGSTEQHGPTGLIGTDSICPETIALGVAERMKVLVGPTLSIGIAQHHMAFPGSMTLRPSTLIAVIKDVVTSLVRHGFDRIYFLNGHGGNIATVNAAFAEIHTAISLASPSSPRTDLRLHLANWFAGPRVLSLARELFGNMEGCHATPSEISLTWHAFPHTVQRVALQPKIAPTGSFGDAADFRKRFPDGRIGSDPNRASLKAGKQFFEASVTDALEDYRRFLAEP